MFCFLSNNKLNKVPLCERNRHIARHCAVPVGGTRHPPPSWPGRRVGGGGVYLGYLPILGWGYPPSRSGMDVPPNPGLGWRYSPSWPLMGYPPPPSWPGMAVAPIKKDGAPLPPPTVGGTRPPPPKCEQTHACENIASRHPSDTGSKEHVFISPVGSSVVGKRATHSRNVIFGVSGSTIAFFRTVEGGFPFWNVIYVCRLLYIDP